MTSSPLVDWPQVDAYLKLTEAPGITKLIANRRTNPTLRQMYRLPCPTKPNGSLSSTPGRFLECRFRPCLVTPVSWV